MHLERIVVPNFLNIRPTTTTHPFGFSSKEEQRLTAHKQNSNGIWKVCRILN